MFLWFAGVSLVFVWAVFKSPALDYRLVMLGAVLPLGEVALGGPRLLHTLVFVAVVSPSWCSPPTGASCAAGSSAFRSA
jgi:hypothetical protein